MAFDVFISYSNKDKLAADAACAALEAAHIRCWIAPRDIMPGADWGASIIDAIDQCRVTVLIFSANANDSPQIRNEIVHAVQRGVPVIPVRIENVAPAKSLAYYMGAVHWLDALTAPLEAHLVRLAESVRAMLQLDADASPLPVQLAEAPPVAGTAPSPSKPSPLSVDRQAAVGRRSLQLTAVAVAAALLLAIGSGVWLFRPPWLNLFTQSSGPPSGGQQAEPLAPSTAVQPDRSTVSAPTPPVVAAPPPSAAPPRDTERPTGPKGAAIQDLLMARLVSVVPKLALSTRERVAREYAESRGHKAQAVSLQPPGTWRANSRASADVAAEAALEGCQAFHDRPCALIAINESLQPVPDDDTWPVRDMPRVRYSGEFDPERIPGVAHLRLRSDIAGYAAAAEPKAVAYHPASQVFVVTGAATQRAAEERALDVCNRDQGRPNGLGPCFLYAIRNQVVLPRRLTRASSTN